MGQFEIHGPQSYSLPRPAITDSETEQMSGQIHADHLHSVAFLYVKVPGKSKPICGGTGFFLEMELPDRVGIAAYFVTCFHVIESADKRGDIFIRINLCNGGFKDIPVAPRCWFKCRESDLAVANVDIALDPETYKPVPLKWLVTSDQIGKQFYPVFGIGSEVFYAGLFSPYAGERRNYPVARFATIALMPTEEKLPLNHTEVDGYLIETHSWGGYSGSPVFLYAPINHPELSPWQDPPISQYTGMLLGVLHAHYPMSEPVTYKSKEIGSVVNVNSGLAIVSTSQLLYDFLMSRDIEMDRKKLSDKIKRQRSQPTMDANLIARSVVEAAIGEPLTTPKKAIKKAKKRSKRTSR